MLARMVLAAVMAGATVVPALAGMMNADEARRFVAGKVFAFIDKEIVYEFDEDDGDDDDDFFSR